MINIKFMNKIKKVLIFTLIAGFAFNTNTQAQDGLVSSTAVTSATIIAPLTLDTNGSTMAFGTLSVNGTTGGTAILSTAGVVSGTDDVDVIGAGGSAVTAAITGEKDQSYSVTVSETTMLRLDTDSGEEITGTKVLPLSAFTLTQNTVSIAVGTEVDSSGTGNDIILASTEFIGKLTNVDGATLGTAALLIGATITLDAAQVPGTYVGEISVAVHYD